MSSDDEPSGIKSVSLGFGPDATAAPGAVAPAPPYRVLIAGDFGLARNGERIRAVGRDLADLLAAASPAITVETGNRLGSFPATLAATVRLATLKDLRPAELVRQLDDYETVSRALANGDREALVEAGSRYDRLVERLSPSGAAPISSESPRAQSAASDADGASGNGADDGLDALFDLVDTAKAPARAPEDTPAASRLSAFIAENITPARKSSSPTSMPEQQAASAAALLDEQARAFLSDRRLSAVLENWHGLRLLLGAAGTDRGIDLTLIEAAVDMPADDLADSLAGPRGVLHLELFDLVLFANRCAASGNGADVLKRLAEAADGFDTVALATLEPDFAREPATVLARLDAPHQAIAGAGFEAFNALRMHADSERLGVFWNDVLAVEGTPVNPEYFLPAAWVATAMIARNVVASGWPGLRASARNELDGFAVAARVVRGGEAAIATRVLVEDDSAGGLASIGVATLNGRLDRDSVRLVHAPLLSATTAHDLYAPKLNDQLVLARLSQIMQAVLPEVLAETASLDEKAARLEARFADYVAAIASAPRFIIGTDESDPREPHLAISVVLPDGIAAKTRYEFQIPA